MPLNSPAEKEIWKKLEPYAQLVSSLLPRADSVSVFDAEGSLCWTTESTLGPDLPNAIQSLLEGAHQRPHEAGQRLQIDGDEFPYYVWWLRNDDGQFIAVVAISTRKAVEGDSSSFEFVNQMVRPAMECLRRELAAQGALLSMHASLSARDKDVELLLRVTDTSHQAGGDKIDELKVLLQNAADHMSCTLVALIVPDKNIAMMRPGKDRQVDGSLVARTHRQLLQLMTTRRESVVINRVGETGGNASAHRILCSPVKLPSGRVGGMLALYRDSNAAEFQARDARLVEMLARRASASIEASYDSLSGLLTRPALEQRTVAALAEDANRRTWCALYLDCDQLHVANENFGMHVGDQVLAQLGELIRNRLPPGGLGSRISGDRFALMLPLRREESTEFADQLRAGAEQLGMLSPNARLHFSVTIGVAQLEQGSDAFAHALAAAESACKAGKDRGRNRVEVYEEADVSIIRRFTDITTAGDLRTAIAENRMRLDAQLIQPIGAPGQHAVPHYELLLRMIDPLGETVGPDRFLSAAQRYQMMPTIDRWVIEQAISQLSAVAGWLKDRPVVFSVNFSGQSLNDEAFQDFLFERLEHCALDPRVFCFELTESDAIANIGKAEGLMRRLRKLDCGVALDDFGTGLSSLSYLRALPVTLLKIDGSFVRDILKDPRAESMVQAIAQLSRTMQLATVAEYVETPEIQARLVSLGVDYAQGFAVGRPQPLTSLLEELPLLCSATVLPPDVSANMRRLRLEAGHAVGEEQERVASGIRR
ncbi:MAG: EAL domain-containing protein [Sinobacteraceae bacterium]|nr:EAL domain-containing protein [Nevskiaceae bacterium]MCP5338616.1 EAL domain-containing protein [Nevskiaceae bacterium]MCP5466705.1 EAL domain-containing protein [Nevskiaceae bacterium]